MIVLFGPFNENIVADENKAGFRALRDGIITELKSAQATVIVPKTLPSELYADASHPLTQGYEMLAREVLADTEFQKFIGAK